MKESSLTCKCVFHRPELNAKREPHGIELDLEIKKWNIPKDRAQRVVERNGAISLVIMFATRVGL